MKDVVNKGDEISVKVIKLDREHKKIALSLKEVLIDQNQANRDDIVVEARSTEHDDESSSDEEASEEDASADEDNSDETEEDQTS